VQPSSFPSLQTDKDQEATVAASARAAVAVAAQRAADDAKQKRQAERDALVKDAKSKYQQEKEMKGAAQAKGAATADTMRNNVQMARKNAEQLDEMADASNKLSDDAKEYGDLVHKLVAKYK
jgi:hypothetical protein